MALGQLTDDVKIAVDHDANVIHYGEDALAGVMPSPRAIFELIEKVAKEVK